MYLQLYLLFVYEYALILLFKIGHDGWSPVKSSRQGFLKLTFVWTWTGLIVIRWQYLYFSSVAQLCLTLQPNDLKHTRPPCPSPTPAVHPNPCQHWAGDAIQLSHPLSSPSPALNLSQHQGLFKWVSSSHQVAKVLEFQLQHQSFGWIRRTDLYDGLVGSPCSPRDSQESSPTPQFKSINSSVLSFLNSSTLTFIHDHWKNHSLD